MSRKLPFFTPFNDLLTRELKGVANHGTIGDPEQGLRQYWHFLESGQRFAHY